MYQPYPAMIKLVSNWVAYILSKLPFAVIVILLQEKVVFSVAWNINSGVRCDHP